METHIFHKLDSITNVISPSLDEIGDYAFDVCPLCYNAFDLFIRTDMISSGSKSLTSESQPYLSLWIHFGGQSCRLWNRSHKGLLNFGTFSP